MTDFDPIGSSSPPPDASPAPPKPAAPVPAPVTSHLPPANVPPPAPSWARGPSANPLQASPPPAPSWAKPPAAPTQRAAAVPIPQQSHAPAVVPPAPYTLSSASAAPSPQSIITQGVAPPETMAQKVRAYAGLIAAFVLLIALTYGVAAIPAPLVPPPSAYAPFSAGDGSFTADAPMDWKNGEYLNGVLFKKKQAFIKIDVAAMGSDGSEGQPGAAQMPDVGAVHAQGKNRAADDPLLSEMTMQNYQESLLKVPPDQVTTTRISEWTAQVGDMAVPYHGYRATILNDTGTQYVTVLCLCPARNWADLHGAYRHVIQSVRQPTGQSSSYSSGGSQ